MAFRVVVGHAEAGFALIPSGSFMMGDALDGSEEPHEVNVSAFQMAQKTVTWAEWNAVRAWGASRGYSDLSAGEAKGDEHPVYSVSWADAVKWSNARSEMEGLTPCYTVGGNVMKTGGMVPSVNWAASGYRLPTEAEWEKAARGGMSGKRFPWGDTITHDQANYYSMTGLVYDISGTRAYHPVWATGVQPWSAPVGTFAANGYGLYDMSGNGWQWCWDWFGPYDLEAAADPRGAATGSDRIFRGGGWGSGTVLCRTAFRGYYPPATKNNQIGFRVVRALAVRAESAGTQVWTGARFGVVGGSYAWEEAVMDAERRGGRLAMLETSVKSDAVTGILAARGAWPRLWIGLTDSAEEGQWRWLDGSALMEANWAPGQPGAAGTSDEDSGMILGSSEGDAAGRWADAASGSRQSYLIEFPWYRVQPLGVPVNGSVGGYGEYEPGAVVELTATAARWYRFAGWSGDVSSAENPLRVVVGRNLVITPVFVPDLPDISLEGEGGALLSSGVEFSDFSTVKSERSLVIRSAGTGVLSGLGWVIEGADASSFSVGASAQAELAPGGSEVLTIRFVPVGDGLKRAVLRIESNDPDENPFIVQLAGAKSTASELWRNTHFGSLGNTGEARDSEDPDRDGVPNLMEFATGSDPRVFSMSPGELVKNGDLLEFRYWRAKAALSELSFVREFAGETDGPWAQAGGADEVVLSDDGVMQRVLVTVPAGSAVERRFVRLRVDRR
jgi:formylglycine-generating enzyme required for sulfatase activity